MPETPKSFEEQIMGREYEAIEYNCAWQNATHLDDDDEPAFSAGWHARAEVNPQLARARASLSPQTAAVPARQDALEKDELYVAAKAVLDYWEKGSYEPGIESRLTKAVAEYPTLGAMAQADHWESRCLTRVAEHNETMGYIAELEYEIAKARQDAVPETLLERITEVAEITKDLPEWQKGSPVNSRTQPPQAAVGEGDLPKRPHRSGIGKTYAEHIRELEDYADAIEKIVREAIAQRDEARKESENLRRALAEAEFAILYTVKTAALPETETPISRTPEDY